MPIELRRSTVASLYDLALHILKSESVDRIGKSLAGLAFFAVEIDGALDDFEYFLLGCEKLGKRDSVRGFLAPPASDADLVAADVGGGDSEGAGVLAASAMIAQAFVEAELTVNDLCGANGAGGLYLTLLATAAFFKIVCGHALTDDAEVVEVGLYAVVGAAADRDLEFMGKLDLVVALIKTFVDLFAELIGFDQTETAGRALAGDNGTNECSGSSCFKPVRGEKGDERVDIFVFYALDLDRKASGHSDLAASETVGSLSDRTLLVRGDLATPGDNADVEDVIKSLVLKAAESLDTHNVGRC